MVLGIGNDIIAVERIKKVIQKHGQRFLDRTFTPHEQKYCEQHVQSFRNYAGRFAAKESIVKALGTGFREGVGWLDIEIRNDLQGKPYVQLSENLRSKLSDVTIMISISHCEEYATAVAIITSQGR